jgi:hypothetical protein
MSDGGGKMLAGILLMCVGIIWYFGWPGVVFSAGLVLLLFGMSEWQDMHGR